MFQDWKVQNLVGCELKAGSQHARIIFSFLFIFGAYTQTYSRVTSLALSPRITLDRAWELSGYLKLGYRMQGNYPIHCTIYSNPRIIFFNYNILKKLEDHYPISFGDLWIFMTGLT